MVVVIRASAERAGFEPSEAKLPGSKSHSQRAMLLTGLGPGRCLLRGALRAEDTAVLARALSELGASVLETEGGLQVVGAAAITNGSRLELGENGTALRTLGAILPILGQQVVLDGLPGLRARPLAPLLSFLDQSGIPHEGDRLPLAIDGRGMSWDQPIEVDASLSTQVATGALIGMALRHARGMTGSRELLVRRPTSRGYLEVTLECLRTHGQAIEVHQEGEDLRFVLAANSTAPAQWTIPADASAAVFPLVLRAMGGWKLREDTVTGAHPDQAIRADITQLIDAAPDSLVVLDSMGERPDCFPALCALAATRRGQTLLSGAASLRGKESDRIAAMAVGLSALGIEVREQPDGLSICGPLACPAGDDPIPIPAPADHRVVMALALLGSRIDRGIELERDQAVAKSWPGFWDWLGENAEVTRA